MEQQSMYVSRFYVMDPEFEDLIFGTDLREGMVVLVEDCLMRGDPERANPSNPYEVNRVNENNRWCEVTRLKVTPRDGDPLIRFIGLYGDGTKRVRTYSGSFAWVVKKDSLPEG